MNIETYILECLARNWLWLSHIVSESKFNKQRTMDKAREMVASGRLSIVERITLTDYLDRPLITEDGKPYQDFRLLLNEK